MNFYDLVETGGEDAYAKLDDKNSIEYQILNPLRFLKFYLSAIREYNDAKGAKKDKIRKILNEHKPNLIVDSCKYNLNDIVRQYYSGQVPDDAIVLDFDIDNPNVRDYLENIIETVDKLSKSKDIDEEIRPYVYVALRIIGEYPQSIESDIVSPCVND